MLRKELLKVEQEKSEIDWFYISKALEFYQKLGYRYVELPWIVSKASTETTWPGEPLDTQAGNLVGSAEQGFVERFWYLSGEEKYVAATPCFRIENQFDKWHQLSFFKIELFSKRDMWEEFLEDARDLFYSFGVNTIETNESRGKDLSIQAKDLLLEVGSYGFRRNKISDVEMSWSFGTGLAEPRFSSALKYMGIR